MGDEKAREELASLTESSVFDPNDEIRKWRLAQTAKCNDGRQDEVGSAPADVPAPKASCVPDASPQTDEAAAN
eukprot:1189547-Pleurochrysis_carterae.AAC.1